MKNPSATTSAVAPSFDLLALVLDQLATAVGVLRAPDFRYELANAACQVIAPGRSFLGRTFAEVAPDLVDQVTPLLRRVVETGEPFHATDLRLDLPYLPGAPPAERYFTFSYVRLAPDASGQPAVLATVTETTEAVLARRTLERVLDDERIGRLREAHGRQLTAAMAAAGSAEAVAKAALEHGLAAFGASGGLMVMEDGVGSLTAIGAVGYPSSATAPWRRFPVGAEVPLAEAYRTAQPVYLSSRAEIEARFPRLAGLAPESPALAALPLVVDGRCIGALGLRFGAPRGFSEADVDDAAWLAQKCGQALERARLADAERRTRHWLERLQAATAAASAASTPQEVAAAVTWAGLQDLGTAQVVVFRLEAGGLQVVGSRGLPAPEQVTFDRLPLDAPYPAAEVARTGAPVFLSTRTECAARFPAAAALQERLCQHALASLPLLARDELVGVLGIGFAAERRFDADERSFLMALAGQAGLALLRARSFQAEQQARAEATRIGAQQEQLMAVVGHDLRTPLTAIRASADVLLRHGGLTPDVLGKVDRISRSAARMTAIIRDLLDFSRLRQGLSILLSRGPLDVGALVRQAIQELEAGSATSRFELSVAGDLRIEGDAGRLGQVISNLIGNAVQHGAGTPVRVDLVGGGEGVRLSVRNGGPPIAGDVLPYLFEPFRRGAGKDPAGDRAGSVGLGLFIALEILKAHGGRIEVCSSEADGTCFEAHLPRG